MTTARGFLGAGDIYISRFDTVTQAFLPYRGSYESTKFEVKATTKLVELTSRGRESYGQIVESVPLQQPTEFSIELAEVNKESLTMALLGTQATFLQAASTTSDEVVVAHVEGWSPLLKHTVLPNSVVVTNSAGAVVYVEGVDYVVNYQLGWIKAKLGGAIVENQSLKVDYGWGAVTGTRIRGAVNAQLRAKILFDGINQADGSPAVVECYEAVLSSSAAFDFLSDKFNGIPLAGRLKTPIGKSEPFEVRLPLG